MWFTDSITDIGADPAYDSTMSKDARILVVDDDKALATALEGLLSDAGHEVHCARNGPAALDLVREQPTDLVLLDLRLGTESGLDLLPQLKSLRPEMSVILITAMGSIEDAVRAMQLGADNFITKPLDPPRFLTVVEKGVEAARLRRRSSQFERLAGAGTHGIHGSSEALAEVVNLIETVAPRETTVLLRGETGTGKGLLARRVHELSSRRKGPFVELNCAGLQRELAESELFGHERGAFTGANERKLGLFEAAEGGSLFLDEIGETDPAVQAKLLKVLESKRFRRVGGVTEIEADVRLLAATHRDLKLEASQGRFREDLLYRLNVFSIPIPPLRDRPEDVAPLAHHFLAEFGNGAGGVLSEAAATMLEIYSWPGNVRELRNVMERASILCPPGQDIRPEHLPPLLDPVPEPGSPADEEGESMDESQRRLVENALRANGGNIKAAANDLGVSRGTLYRKVRKYGIET